MMPGDHRRQGTPRRTHAATLMPWLARYQRGWLGPDVVAGIATAAVVLPQAMAYAAIAGLPVQYGLYVATVPLVVYALVGTSRPLSVSTTSTVAALTATAISSIGPASATEAAAVATTLAVVAGTMLLAAGCLRLGYVADFISVPVLAGFKVGTALVIVAGQLGKVLGVPVSGDNFFAKVRSALTQLDDANPATVVLAGTTVAALLALRRWAPRVPGALVGVAGGILAVAVGDLVSRGVAVVPPVPSGLPRPQLPDLGLVPDLLPAALGVALMAFVESIASARAYERDRDVALSADRELLALGAAGVAGGTFQSLPVAGGLSQTAVNDGNGARSPVAGAVTGVFGMLTLLVLTPLFEDLADATLGAVVLVAVLGLLDLTTLRAIARIRRRDFLLGVVAAAGILLFGVLAGVLIAVVISVIALVHGLNVMPVRVLGRHANGHYGPIEGDAVALPTVLIVAPEGGLYFANVGRVLARIDRLVHADPGLRVVIINAAAIPDIETTAAMSLAAFEQRLARQGLTLHVACPTPRVEAMLAAARPDGSRRHVHETLDAALAAPPAASPGPDAAARPESPRRG